MEKTKHPSFFIDGIEYKKCNRCRKDKLINCFSDCLNKNREPYKCNTCKICRKKSNDRNIIYRAKNKEKIKHKLRLYKEKNKEKINETNKCYEKRNKEKIAYTKKLYAKKNREKINKRSKLYKRRQTLNLNDTYIKGILTHTFQLKTKEILPIMIEYKRAALIMKRKARKLKKINEQ